jgi:ubiquinone/menaquinone biosynthesis C-methylase UbiE
MEGRNETIARRFHPGYRSPKRAYEAALERHVRPGTVWLDLGCGRTLSGDPGLNERLTKRAGLVVGCDADPHLERHATVRDLTLCDAAALPFQDDTFDLVTSSMVAEHLREPEKVFAEVARVSKPNAVFIVFTPNKWNYAMLVARATPYAFHLLYKRLTHYFNRGEWRSFEDDVFPTYYRANTVGRLRQLMRSAGFEDVEIERLSLAHSFGFVRPLYILSLLFERLIDRRPLQVFKADLLAIGVKRPLAVTAHPVRVAEMARPIGESGVAVAEAVSARQGRRVATGGGA